MSAVVLVVIAGYVLLELAVASVLAAAIGWGWVLVVMAALAILGIAVMRNAGIAAARSLRGAGQVGPTGIVAPAAGTGAALGDASLRFAAGLLIALPGLVTSAFGLLLLVAPIRKVLGVGVVGWFVNHLRRRGISVVSGYRADGTGFTRVVPGDVVEGEVVPPTDQDDPPPPADPPQLST